MLNLEFYEFYKYSIKSTCAAKQTSSLCWTRTALLFRQASTGSLVVTAGRLTAVAALLRAAFQSDSQSAPNVKNTEKTPGAFLRQACQTETDRAPWLCVCARARIHTHTTRTHKPCVSAGVEVLERPHTLRIAPATHAHTHTWRHKIAL